MLRQILSHYKETYKHAHTHAHTNTQICNKTYYVTRKEGWMFLKWIML